MNTMTFNNFNDIAFNVAELLSNSAQILIQMQSCIEQLERQHWQQQLKIEKSDQFDKIKKKLRQWLIQMNVHFSAQFYQLKTEDNKIMLIISYLTGKTVDWIQSYINKKFHLKKEKDKIFSSYKKFVKKIITVFESVNSKKEAECKLEHLKQKESALNYAVKFKQIVSVLNWNDEVYVSLFYWEFKDEVKNELAKIEWLDDLNDMIRIVIQIDNWLWKRQQEKRKENSWKNQQEWNKDKKKDCEQSMNWKYINNWKMNIFKNDCWKKELCFHCKKKRHQVKECRSLQQEKSTETWTWVIMMKQICEKKWCQNMKCQQHHLRQNLIKNWL